MSLLTSVILGNPALAAKFMTGMGPDYWVKKGQEKALASFKNAAANVPAYRQFLAEHEFDASRVRTIADFSTVPISDRPSYIAGRSFDQLIAGKVTDAHLFYMSGGTTGDSMIGAGSRENINAYPPSLAGVLNYQWGLCEPDNKVLIVNAMSLGAWIAGTYASAIFQKFSERWRNVSFTAPGADVDRILDLVEALGPYFDTLVLVSYPTLIKETLHAGKARGIDWKSLGVKLIVSGEKLDLALRYELLSAITDPIDHHAIMDQYGTSEMGNPGADTPLSCTLLRLAADNKALCRDIFGEDEPLTLMQSNPLGTYVETVDGRLIGTGGNVVPVIRYAPKDSGTLMGYREMLALVEGHGVDIRTELSADGWTKANFQWPFLIIVGRADYAVSIYGAKISPQTLQDVFAADPRVRRFRLRTDETGEYATLIVDLEMPHGLELSEPELETMREYYRDVVHARLVEINFDYADAYSIRPDALTPRIMLHDQDTGPFHAAKSWFKPKAL
ncbi:MAG TPA: hypothetical protein VFG89_09985 [Coriobacteriia bacterium]|nr:hypothetical protein [Coriobacteriia bacterium]